MGLLQKLMETYECHKDLAGKYQEGHAVLAPVGHIVTRSNLEITLDAEGNFCSATVVDKSEPKILIPATESSAGRSSGIAPHPLCDQLGYLSPCNQKKYEAYCAQLRDWQISEYSHPMLLSVLNYVKKGRILEDLEQCGLIKRKDDGAPEDEKMLVRWRVLGVGEENACWKNTKLFHAFIHYYCTAETNKEQDICMITGAYSRMAEQHPKGVIAFNGNAKLISANDDSGFTYRGRFCKEQQAVTVSYEASQKSHSALRWLVSEQGNQVVFGNRTFLCWNPEGRKVCTATGAFRNRGTVVTKPTDFSQELKETLSGWRSELPEQAGVVIAAFDAATSGRLSVTYYNELQGSDFLERLYNWDLHCSWPTRKFGIQSPSLFEIASCAFGTQQTVKGKPHMACDDRVLRQQIQRLVSCRIDCAQMPSDIVKALLDKASVPLAYDKYVRESILVTACAVIRKYRFDKFKEEWDMTLDPDKKDISYQYGRLLAVLEKAERDTYDGNTDREPNAIRQQSVFCQRPMYAAAGVQKQLERAYFPRLKPGSRAFYRNLIGEIMEKIAQFPEDRWNKPLKETYLMGYYLQRNALYTKKNQDNNETEE